MADSTLIVLKLTEYMSNTSERIDDKALLGEKELVSVGSKKMEEKCVKGIRGGIWENVTAVWRHTICIERSPFAPL